jgi:hypothetical protein
MNMLASSAVFASATAASAATEADPIFEAVATHRKAYDAFNECLTRQSRLEDELPKDLRQSKIDAWEVNIVETDDPRWIAIEKEVRRLDDAEVEASIALIDIEPTTLLGAAHLMGYVVEREASGGEWPSGLVEDDAPPAKFGKPWAFFLHRNLAEFITRMAAA